MVAAALASPAKEFPAPWVATAPVSIFLFLGIPTAGQSLTPRTGTARHRATSRGGPAITRPTSCSPSRLWRPEAARQRAGRRPPVTPLHRRRNADARDRPGPKAPPRPTSRSGGPLPDLRL